MGILIAHGVYLCNDNPDYNMRRKMIEDLEKELERYNNE